MKIDALLQSRFQAANLVSIDIPPYIALLDNLLLLAMATATGEQQIAVPID